MYKGVGVRFADFISQVSLILRTYYKNVSLGLTFPANIMIFA